MRLSLPGEPRLALQPLGAFLQAAAGDGPRSAALQQRGQPRPRPQEVPLLHRGVDPLGLPVLHLAPQSLPVPPELLAHHALSGSQHREDGGRGARGPALLPEQVPVPGQTGRGGRPSTTPKTHKVWLLFCVCVLAQELRCLRE